MKLELNDHKTTHQEQVTLFADVILPVPVPKLFTYRVPQFMNDGIQQGCRVIVQFGKKKILTGIVGKIHEKAPSHYEAKYILELLDDRPTINDIQLRFLFWMARYYMCTPGDVINAGIPSGLKLSSESRIQLNPDHEKNEQEELSEQESDVLDALEERDTLTYSDVSELTNRKTVYPVIKSLIDKGLILLFEEVKEKYKPKKEKRLRLKEAYVNETALEELLSSLEKKEKQQEAILKYLSKVPVLAHPDKNKEGILKADFQEGLSASSIKTLEKNGVFELYDVNISRLDFDLKGSMSTPELSENQKDARDQILSSFSNHNITLLHGITGSGKTEIYIDLILEVLDEGYQVLYLLPEIALSTQIVERLRKVFGSVMGVYHSRFSDNERVEVWRGVAEGRYQFVVGVRSSIFLPFDNLGLVIIDEEHETSYKQYDPAPRYHARDSALMLARMHDAKALLGSATPSMESYYHASNKEYGLVSLFKRYGKAQLPHIIPVENKRSNQLGQSQFTVQLIDAIRDTVADGKQAIIFQNRRGFAPFLICEDCNHIPMCHHCNVSLTYHQFSQELRCHYCGYSQPAPTSCDACGSTHLKHLGHGTEKIEENLKLLLPDIIVQRMDLDTTRRKNSYERILTDFQRRTIDVLVGTQMISKGLDFDHIQLVGIFDADRIIHFPDFRSHERAFQLITQVSGRAGRREEPGTVIIQTNDPGQPILQQIIQQDYIPFYKTEIAERKAYAYPPFTRIIKLTVKCQDINLTRSAGRELALQLRKSLGKQRVLGPEEPPINKIRNYYLNEIMIKLERKRHNLRETKQFIRACMDHVTGQKAWKSVIIVPNVDPV